MIQHWAGPRTTRHCWCGWPCGRQHGWPPLDPRHFLRSFLSFSCFYPRTLTLTERTGTCSAMPSSGLCWNPVLLRGHHPRGKNG